MPHYGHVLTSFVKDTIPRFKTQQGYYVSRKWGWDCHGLPVEHEVNKRLKLNDVAAIETFGIKRYNEICRSVVLKYSQEWKTTIRRLGRWVDFDNGYKTMDLRYMEKVWSSFKQLYDQNYIYMSTKVIPYSVGRGTVLSKVKSERSF